MSPLLPVGLQLCTCGNGAGDTRTERAFVVAANVDCLQLVSFWLTSILGRSY
jgi:hypothetical protein